MHPPNPAPVRRTWLAGATLAVAVLAGCAAARPTPTQAPAPAAAASAPSQAALDLIARQKDFADWVADFSTSARAAGIAEETLRVAFDGVQFIPLVVDLDRAQPEFTRTAWEYLDRTVTRQRITLGQEKLSQHRAEADAATARYGVPSSILTAIWGMESNYGSNYGDIPTIDALATLGFEGRRADWARGQLLAALKILQSGDIDRARMIGSWAGAMGQTQFLPSSFLAYAVDADGDGRRDIWGSMADVLASTANFLARVGWRAGQPWGVEVKLPPGFDVGRADAAVRLTSEQWAAEGVQSADGAPLLPIDEGAILLPAGARGPAFLTGPNFRAILRYNNSTSYALAVSLLAQRLANGPGVLAPWPRDLQALTRTQLLELQTALNGRGFDSGAPDGLMGPVTRGAIRRYQRSIDMPADGYPNQDLLQRLQIR